MRRTLAVVVAMSACSAPHVTLVPPPPAATPEQRVQAFYALAGQFQTTELRCSYNGRRNSCQVVHSITLIDGRKIDDPRDLAPVLAPTTASAGHVRAYETARHHSIRWAIVGSAFFLGGIVGTAGAATEHSVLGAEVGVGSVVTGLVILAIGGIHYGLGAQNESKRAFDTYNASLAESLHVCFTGPTGLQVVACELQGPPSLTPPSAENTNGPALLPSR